MEGARHPFIVLTDHKNLQYLREARRLNPRQARRALFFTRFHFIISYHPGSKNVKADALSRLHTPDETPEQPEPVLPFSLIVSPIQWEQIAEATLSEPALPGCPAGRIYVPKTLEYNSCILLILHWALATQGPQRPSHYYKIDSGGLAWLITFDNTSKAVRNVLTSKVPRHLPTGKLLPLPVPCRPW